MRQSGQYRFPFAVCLLFVLAGLASSAMAAGADEVVRVFKVFDGDSFIGRTRYRSIRMHLDGVKSAPLRFREGLAAKQVLEKMIASKRVNIRPMGPVEALQLPVRVRYLDKDINLEMVRSGYVWVWPRDGEGHADLMAAEQQAREAGKGVWADPAAVAPWIRLVD